MKRATDQYVEQCLEELHEQLYKAVTNRRVPRPVRNAWDKYTIANLKNQTQKENYDET